MTSLLPLTMLLPLAAPPGVATAADLARVRLLDGPFKQIQELHRTGLLGHLQPDLLLFPFRRNAHLPQPPGVTHGYGGWDDGFIAGHYAGHYLTAAARMYAATGDTALRDKTAYMVGVLAECQTKLGGGYLSAFPEERFDRLERTPRQAACDYYTIHKILAGLVDVARYCDNDQALDIAERMANHFAGRVSKLSYDQGVAMCRTDYAGNPTNEFGGLTEALCDLHALRVERGRTAPCEALQLAVAFFNLGHWFVDPLERGEDHLAGLHGNTHIAQATGLARFALLIGDQPGGQQRGAAAAALWRLVTQHHTFANGGNTFNEKLRAADVEVAGHGDAELGPLVSEYCNTNNMLKLTRTLCELAPSVELGDYYECALFNHILAAIAPDTGHVMYHMSLRPGDFRVHINEPFCCQGTGLENAARFGEAIYFQRGDELWVSQFLASTLDWRERGLRLRLDTRYPEDGQVRLIVTSGGPTAATLHLRVPGWLAGQAEARVNGTAVPTAPVPGQFLTVTRTWQAGDLLELRLPLALRVRPSHDDPRTVSFYHGPVLLAGQLGREGLPASDSGSHVQLKDAPRWPVPVLSAATLDHGAGLGYSAEMTQWTDGRRVTVALAPFYQVQHQRYAVYWTVVPPAELDAYAQRMRPQAPPLTFIGDAAAERDLDLRGERTTTGVFAGRPWRDARDGGWFSYRLPLPAQGAAQVVCTYWGGETGNRVFDVVVGDRTLATQTLKLNRPGAFFDVAYPLPAELTHGQQFVTVRFQAHAGAQAGGVFSVRCTGSP